MKAFSIINEYEKFKNLLGKHLGYPANADFDYSGLYQFLEIPLNNVGDPFNHSNYPLNTHEFEKEVIKFIAHLYNAEQDFWGYINNGGTEGNLCALNIARNIYQDGIVYYSDSSHYSIPKSINITRSKAVKINCIETGEMSYSHLEEALAKNNSSPAILICNIGTTMTGAIDDIFKIKQLLFKTGIKNYYIHCDCALHGMMLPFLKGYKFSLNEVHSLSISGHKFIGCPIPCGIYLTQKKIIDSQSNYIEYVGINDATITGSRNALSPLFLWYLINNYGKKGLADLAHKCIELADYSIQKAKEYSIHAWRNHDSPIVVFPRPSTTLTKKWPLALYKDISHIVILGHVDKPMIDRFIYDFHLDLTGKPLSDEIDLNLQYLARTAAKNNESFTCRGKGRLG